MKTGAKVLLGGLVIGGGALLIRTLTGKLSQAAPPSNPNFTIKIYDAEGNLVATSEVASRGVAAFPGSLVEGGTGYTAVVTVTNTSKYPDGTLAPYTFQVLCQASVVNTSAVFINSVQNLFLAAGATGSLSFAFNIPYGGSGTGTATAYLMKSGADGGGIITQATVGFAISPATITPGGTITF